MLHISMQLSVSWSPKRVKSYIYIYIHIMSGHSYTTFSEILPVCVAWGQEPCQCWLIILSPVQAQVLTAWFFFLPILLWYNWHTALCKFRVYSLSNDLTYIDHKMFMTERLIHVFHLNINAKKYFDEWWELYDLNNFCIYYTAVLSIVIMLCNKLFLVIITGRLCLLTTVSSFTFPQPLPLVITDLFLWVMSCCF